MYVVYCLSEKTVGIPAAYIVLTKPVIDLMADVYLGVMMDLVVTSVFKVYVCKLDCYEQCLMLFVFDP